MSARIAFRFSHRHLLYCLLVWVLPVSAICAGYKARPYVPLAIESYPASLSSEGLTVAVEPMFTDALASRAFDKKDIVARGIMPVAIIISNNNEFAIEVNGGSIELLVKGERIRSVGPDQAIMRLYQYTLPTQEVRIPSPVPFPRVAIKGAAGDAFDDFSHKYLGIKRVEPKSVAAGFLYLPVKGLVSIRDDLAEAQIYIPELRRADTLEAMMFLEIDLKPAVTAAAKQ